MQFNDLLKLRHGDILEHKTMTNANGTPIHCRVNGRLKTWKRDPNRFQLPVKHGLYNCFYITADNIADWQPQS